MPPTNEASGGWEVDCQYRKHRIRQRGFPDYRPAETFLTQRKAAIYDAVAFGILPPMTLEEAAAKYLEDKLDRGMPSAVTDDYLLEPVIETIGSLTLEEICNDSVAPFVAARQAKGIKNKSINNALSCISRIRSAAPRGLRRT